jgi:hypothetical protein
MAPSRWGTAPGNGSPTVNDVIGISSMMAHYIFKSEEQARFYKDGILNENTRDE